MPIIIGNSELWIGDCREILSTLVTADAVITDPPYGIPHLFGKMRASNSGIRTFNFEWDGPDTFDMVMAAAKTAAVLADAQFWFCGFGQYAGIEAIFLAAGLVPKPAAWIKKCPPPAGKGNWWPSGFELALYAYRSGAWFGDKNNKRSNVFYSDSYRYGQPGKVAHPTQKPLGLICKLIASLAKPGGTVIDPFMGSGTTGVACMNLGRKFIGIEINRLYFDIACERIENEQRQQRLFS